MNGLIVAYCGFGQDAKTFAENSRLQQTALEFDLAIVFPQKLTRNWTKQDAARVRVHVADARTRRSVADDAPVYLVGFSDGGTLVHRAVAFMPELAGVWVHSGVWPSDAKGGSVPAVVSCNHLEQIMLPRFGFPWYSMLDYREMAIGNYKTVKGMIGVGRHRWDHTINREAIQWLVASHDQ